MKTLHLSFAFISMGIFLTLACKSRNAGTLKDVTLDASAYEESWINFSERHAFRKTRVDDADFVAAFKCFGDGENRVCDTPSNQFEPIRFDYFSNTLAESLGFQDTTPFEAEVTSRSKQIEDWQKDIQTLNLYMTWTDFGSQEKQDALNVRATLNENIAKAKKDIAAIEAKIREHKSLKGTYDDILACLENADSCQQEQVRSHHDPYFKLVAGPFLEPAIRANRKAAYEALNVVVQSEPRTFLEAFEACQGLGEDYTFPEAYDYKLVLEFHDKIPESFWVHDFIMPNYEGALRLRVLDRHRPYDYISDRAGYEAHEAEGRRKRQQHENQVASFRADSGYYSREMFTLSGLGANTNTTAGREAARAYGDETRSDYFRMKNQTSDLPEFDRHDPALTLGAACHGTKRYGAISQSCEVFPLEAAYPAICVKRPGAAKVMLARVERLKNARIYKGVKTTDANYTMQVFKVLAVGETGATAEQAVRSAAQSFYGSFPTTATTVESKPYFAGLENVKPVIKSVSGEICLCGPAQLSSGRAVCGLWTKPNDSSSYTFQRSAPRDNQGQCSESYCRAQFTELGNAAQCRKVRFGAQD